MNTLLKSYLKMGMYDYALKEARLVYLDEWGNVEKMRKEAGVNANQKYTDRWLQNIFILGKCYVMLKDYDGAEKLYSTYETQLLKKEYSDEVFFYYAIAAENYNQLSESLRRIKIALMRVDNINLYLKLKAMDALIRMKYNEQTMPGDHTAYENTKRLVNEMQTYKNVDPQLKNQIEQELLIALLEYSFDPKHTMSERFTLVDYASSKYKGNNWPKYWILKAISDMFNQTGLKTACKKYIKLLEDDSTTVVDGAKPIDSIVINQLKLVQETENIKESITTFKDERILP